ncbi:flippase [uncultured Clostridium sp.]|mgnify:CR=1 FL=1|uniref:flippase n=1 Tax=uncultured Clostridium sp. TaxID=59620 RepID=UPI00266F0C86|nr:flippase [uncultured Clostridium sp.]
MQVAKNFLYNVSYQLLVIILPLITVPYVSNILGAEGIGDYAFTYANMQYFVIFGMVGITLYGNRQIAYVRDNKEKLRNTFFSIYTLQLITTTISFILYLIFVLVFNNGDYKWLYIVQGINIIASMTDISWLFMGLEQFKKTVVRNTIVKLASLASIFIFVKSSNHTVIYTLILALSALVGNLTFWLYVPKAIGFKSIKISELNLHLKASLALFIPQIAIQIYVLLDRTMLGAITDTVQVGFYENSQKIVKIVLTLATAIGTVMMPKIANTVASGDMKKVKYYIKNSFFFVSALSIPLMFGLMGVAPELSPWFFGNNFAGIEKLIIISSLIILAISWSNVLGMQLLVPLNKTKEFTISVTSGAIINFVLNLVLIKNFGATGACISTIIAEFTVTSVQFYLLKDFIKAEELIKPVLLFIPASIVMYIFVRIIGNSMGAGILTNIVQGMVGVITYFIIIEGFYRVFKKQSIVTYVKDIIKG